MDRVDCIVIGAGVVGLATARALAASGREVIVLEAEDDIGTHTSSRNSEVIHAGIYYPTGSLKARLCVAGKEMLYRYCDDRDIAHRRIGKLIVATSEDEALILRRYVEQAAVNGVHDLEWLDAAGAGRLEPEVMCTAALLSPSTGIVDTHELMTCLQADVENAAGAVICRSRVLGAEVTDSGFVVRVSGDEDYAIEASLLINSAGLWAPQVADSLNGLNPKSTPKHCYAIGHYYTLAGQSPFDRLVYPVAGKAGLGIHVTLDLAGQVRFGPDVRWIEDIDYRFDDSRRDEYTEAIKHYYPGLDESRLVEGYTGIRPKLAGPGEDPADFVIQGPAEHGIDGLVNLYGIESPGLTSSLALAKLVTEKLGVV